MECNFEDCGYYTDGECNICGMGTDGEDTFCKYCKDNPNCYYKQLTELKTDNERLKKELDVALREENRWKSNFNNYRDVCRKQYQTLQEIKETAEQLLEKGLEPQSVEHQLRLRGKRELASIILEVITKAESEEV